MAAKDSNSDPVSEVIFGGETKFAPPALKRTVPTPWDRTRSQASFKTVRAELKALAALIEQACQLLKAFRKLFIILLSIILLIRLSWSSLNSKPDALQHLKSVLTLFRR